ncbi:hypothetical protein [Pseudonocardia sp.]|uniref:hypothetical protein n=1 Tax=Pseudonocardia sp. TaxID=60912 RepID=UPI00261DFD5F|nr:hypothetical protein [Pseudonocardia sp.]
MNAEKYAAYVERIVDEAPEFTPEQRVLLRALLAPSSDHVRPMTPKGNRTAA